jgi:2-iminoacetate synthase ThiH
MEFGITEILITLGFPEKIELHYTEIGLTITIMEFPHLG